MLDIPLNILLKRRLTLACIYGCVKRERICNCYDYSKFEEGYYDFPLEQSNARRSEHYFISEVPLGGPKTTIQLPARVASVSNVRSDIPASSDQEVCKNDIPLSDHGTATHYKAASVEGEDEHADLEYFKWHDHQAPEYVVELAQDMVNEIDAYKLDSETIDRLSVVLFPLLEALADRLGLEPHANHDVVEFIYGQRRKIVASFKSICQRASESYIETAPTQTSQSGGFDDAKPPEDTKGFPPIGRSEAFSLPGLDEYKRLIFENPAYRWLLGRLQGEAALSNTEPQILNEIRSKIRQALLPIREGGRRWYPTRTKITYTLRWDILGFLDAQEYNLSAADAIAKAITLTGHHTDAQALSCRDYMTQTWPHTGCKTLEFLQEVLRGNGDFSLFFSFFESRDELMGSGKVRDSSVSIIVKGIPELVVEIGEQLAWIGAALRFSKSSIGVAHCTPRVCFIPKKLDIKHDVDVVQKEYQGTNGQCWHNLFADPVVVRGFPILKRSKTGTGLEMSLDMLVALARARYVDTFKSKVFIKGFSTMLIPTKQSGNLLVWHLLYNKDPNKRISYLDCDLGHQHIDIEMHALGKYRHILGWCSDVVSIVGTTQSKYNIEKSKLPYAHAGCALEKAEVSGGQFVTGTAVFSLGNREKPVHISRFGYLNKLQWISSKHFVFWDEEAKRGWLVNGASALLHILRASLEHSQQKFPSAWLLDPNALSDAAGTPRSQSALEVLINEQNRDLKLYVDKTEVYDEETNDQQRTHKVLKRQTRHYRLEDRIEHIYNIFEKLIDHQTDAERRSGLDIKIRPRRQLEGWDFKDLATDGDPLFPRVAHLQTIGKGWVDFTRALHAVTLFGRGFGDLIQPRFAIPCPRWTQVPSNKYYLAACVLDLQEIMERDGDSNSNPRRLCENIIWQVKQATFDKCPCTGRSTQAHHDPVQILFPLKFTPSLGKGSQIELESHGAVIFGHNMNLHWHWGDHGDPVKGDPPQELENETDTISDSGVGSSLSTSGDSSASNLSNSTPVRTQESPPSIPRDTTSETPKLHFKEVLSSNIKRAWHSFSGK
ncbi:uncharacterized protein F4807DRAFT_409721 [Annulohypoxylon truncatum]|uniref:uncharacterized protein n=1 Tax=Annulohypoxylon truncatum TaxID=327061 RepID=UPI0020083386|nr:uncharacterized protein F4807DRAFT_409721 [Annulohypoxylon truncatum]KAI1213921.1 hypothetical protein F4807DRAFT_409721 [Annulohypoxylon truncatum]